MAFRVWIAIAVKPSFAELIEPKNRVLPGAEGHERGIELRLVENAPVFFVFSTRLVHSHQVAGQRVTRLQHPATDLLGRCARIGSLTVRGETEGADRLRVWAVTPG